MKRVVKGFPFFCFVCVSVCVCVFQWRSLDIFTDSVFFSCEGGLGREQESVERGGEGIGDVDATVTKSFSVGQSQG